MKNFIIAFLISFIWWTTGLIGIVVYFLMWLTAIISKIVGCPLEMDEVMLLTGAAFGMAATINVFLLVTFIPKKKNS